MATAIQPASSRLNGLSQLLGAERRLRVRIFKPRPRLSISEWADRHAVLPMGVSAEPGKWRTSRAPFQRGIMDAISDPEVQEIVWVSSSQIGKTAILLNALGFYIDQEPSTILIVQPSLDFVRDFSRERVKPMLEATDVLRGKVKESTARRESGDTLLRKEFTGGFLVMVGANSPTGLASRPIRIVFFDEVDKYPASAGRMGDPIKLGTNRTRTFWNKKIVKVSTPGIEETSRIAPAYENSDQRRYHVPCPDCGHMQHLRWAQLDFDTCCYTCETCGVLIPETKKPSMLERGEWIAAFPDRKVRGFHLNTLYSPWTTWKEMRDDFLLAKQAKDTLQVFVNEQLAETFKIDGEGVNAEGLAARREKYAAEVPAGVGVLTAGVDVQKDRLELLVKGWGAGQESWLVRHVRLYGDPQQADVWDRLSVWLDRAWAHEAGGTIAIRSLCIDSGDQTQAVYAFVRRRRGAWATKGLSVRGKPIISKPGTRNKYGVRVVPIGTDTAKDVIFARLMMEQPGAPGYMHFPEAQPEGADDEYLQQFGAEKVFIRRVKGIPFREYRAVRARNEAIDLEVLALAALHLLGAAVYDQLGLWVERVQAAGALVKKPDQPPPGEPPPPAERLPVRPPMRPRGGGWVGSWRR